MTRSSRGQQPQGWCRSLQSPASPGPTPGSSAAPARCWSSRRRQDSSRSQATPGAGPSPGIGTAPVLLHPPVPIQLRCQYTPGPVHPPVPVLPSRCQHTPGTGTSRCRYGPGAGTPPRCR